MKQAILTLMCILAISCSDKARSQDYDEQRAEQVSGNEEVIENLKKNGDDETIQRDVFHWIYFKSKQDRKHFLEEVKKQKFIVVVQDEVEDEFSFSLQIKRLDKVDITSVNQYVLYLWDLAQIHHGVYDGWETSIEK